MAIRSKSLHLIRQWGLGLALLAVAAQAPAQDTAASDMVTMAVHQELRTLEHTKDLLETWLSLGRDPAGLTEELIWIYPVNQRRTEGVSALGGSVLSVQLHDAQNDSVVLTYQRLGKLECPALAAGVATKYAPVTLNGTPIDRHTLRPALVALCVAPQGNVLTLVTAGLPADQAHPVPKASTPPPAPTPSSKGWNNGEGF